MAVQQVHQLSLLAGDACRFFVYWLLLFLVHNMAICLFRAIGALSRDLVVANACGSLSLLTIMLMGGFVIPKASVHPWVVWLYWIDPLQWAQRAITINEFSASRWGDLGPRILQIRSFPDHYWCVPQQSRKGQAWLTISIVTSCTMAPSVFLCGSLPIAGLFMPNLCCFRDLWLLHESKALLEVTCLCVTPRCWLRSALYMYVTSRCCMIPGLCVCSKSVAGGQRCLHLIQVGVGVGRVPPWGDRGLAHCHHCCSEVSGALSNQLSSLV